MLRGHKFGLQPHVDIGRDGVQQDLLFDTDQRLLACQNNLIAQGNPDLAAPEIVKRHRGDQTYRIGQGNVGLCRRRDLTAGRRGACKDRTARLVAADTIDRALKADDRQKTADGGGQILIRGAQNGLILIKKMRIAIGRDQGIGHGLGRKGKGGKGEKARNRRDK